MPDLNYGEGDRLAGFGFTSGQGLAVIPKYLAVDSTGTPLSGCTYTLASNVTIAATSGTTPVTGVQGGSYLWDVQIGGGTSVQLQTLGSDGTTWRTVATATTSGTTGVVIGQGASVRLYNPNGSSDTGVYSSLT